MGNKHLKTGNNNTEKVKTDIATSNIKGMADISEKISENFNSLSETKFQEMIEEVLSSYISPWHTDTEFIDESLGRIYSKWKNLLTEEPIKREKLASQLLVTALKDIFPDYTFNIETINRLKKNCEYIKSLGENYSNPFGEHFSIFMEDTVEDESELKDYFKNKLEWEIVVDLFSAWSSRSFFDTYSELTKWISRVWGNPKKLVFVDKYNIDLRDWNADTLYSKWRNIYIPTDSLILTSLLPNNSVNYIMSGIDRCIIKNEKYIDYLKEEIQRTTKEWWLFFWFENDYSSRIWKDMKKIKNKNSFYVYENSKE